MIVSACLFIFGYAMTWAPGIWILIGETFATRTRAKQAALATASNWLWNFLLAFFTPFITESIGYKYGFIFAACNLLGAIVVYFFLYESSDLSLESVDQVCRVHNFPRLLCAHNFLRCTMILRSSRGRAAPGRRPVMRTAPTSLTRRVPPRHISRSLLARVPTSVPRSSVDPTA
jgi:hypothetical protein